MTGQGKGARVQAGGAPGSSFSDVRAQLLSDRYDVLPHHNVTIGTMFQAGKNLLMRDSKTLFDSKADLVPPMQKLLHPTGICLFGRWTITEPSDYTGCFRQGTDHLIIVRCSSLFANTDRGTRRGFGFAGKIFPTLDSNQPVQTANFITIDDLGGTFAKRFTDVALTNQPPTGLNFGMIPLALVVANVLYVFRRTDSKTDYRPLTQLNETGLRPGETPQGPKWLQISAEEGISKSDAIDFREELRVANYKEGKLRFMVSVASEATPLGKRLWRRLGTIELTEDVCSESGDHRIRFWHSTNRPRRTP